jgi:uncharacterized membrane protein YjjB (DUF3815 family)
MEEWIYILLKAFFSGCAALGFGILFNVPKKNLYVIWIGGAIVGLVKFTILYFTPSSIILATFWSSLILGVYSMIMAHKRHESQMIIAIPCVIPLVPGAFAYRTMLGLIKLSGQIGPEYSRTLSETVHDGAVTLFIIMAFSIGIIITNRIGKDITKKLIKN